MRKQFAQIADDIKVYAKLLHKYSLGFWLFFALALMSYLAASGASILVADTMQYVIDSFNDSKSEKLGPFGWFVQEFAGKTFSSELLLRYLAPLSLVGGILIRVFGNGCGAWATGYISETLVHQLRCEVYSHLLTCPVNYFDSNSAGKLIARVNHNVSEVGGAASVAFTAFMQHGLTFMAMLGYAVYLNWKLASIFLIVVPFAAYIILQMNIRFGKHSQKTLVSVSEITRITDETVRGHRETKIFHAQGYQDNLFRGASDRIRKLTLKQLILMQVGPAIIQISLALLLGFILWFAVGPLIANELSPGQFVIFIGLIMMSGIPLRQMGKVSSLMQRGVVASRDIFQNLAMPVEVDVGRLKVSRVKGHIEFKDVSFTYPTNPSEKVLQSINFAAEKGQTIAIVGSSGAGKSTLINLLARFYTEYSGAILLDDIEIRRYNLDSFRRQIAMVGQTNVLFNDTIYNNIAYGLFDQAAADEVHQAAELAYVSHFADQLPDGLQTMIGDAGVRLSGGQRQRIAIARALLKNSAILILDEATSALDNESEMYIQRSLKKLMGERTTLVIAHRLSTVQDADSIIVLEHGKVVEIGNHDALLELQGRYAQLYQKRFSD